MALPADDGSSQGNHLILIFRGDSRQASKLSSNTPIELARFGAGFDNPGMDDNLPKSRRWFRFSLRTMLLMVSISALGVWWLTRPTIVAYQFAKMFRAGDYEQANKLIYHGPKDHPYVSYFATPKRLKSSDVHIVPISWSQIVCRHRILYAEMLSEEHGIRKDWAVTLEATPWGIRTP
jgi:hypothetical protein